jgi:hypothetical protein
VRRSRFLSALIAITLTTGTLGLLGAGAASAAPAGGGGPYVCSGTPKSPGVLTGRHSSVIVSGTCVVNSGRAFVRGNVVVTPGSVLLAAFARNAATGRGTSNLNVGGNVVVQRGATLIMGCSAAHFACIDDPNQKNPTLNSSSAVGGSLVGQGALGIVVHSSTIGGSVLQRGGGGGFTCTPAGVFKQFKSPVYSDYEDNWVGGNLAIAGLHSCWLGALRNHVRHGFLAVSNKMKDPDANELNSNFIRGSMACFGNFPAVQYGDSHGVPNRVGRFAFGQCGFRVLKPNPAPHGPLTPISVRARHHR